MKNCRRKILPRWKMPPIWQISKPLPVMRIPRKRLDLLIRRPLMRPLKPLREPPLMLPQRQQHRPRPKPLLRPPPLLRKPPVRLLQRRPPVRLLPKPQQRLPRKLPVKPPPPLRPNGLPRRRKKLVSRLPMHRL